MRILVVEDEPDLLAGLARCLRDEGYAVDTASDGEEGLYKARETEYDAIVLDVMLPRLSGLQLLAALRLTRKTPVLLLTARDRTADRVEGLDGGADDYLVKPFELPELLARLRAVIRRGSGLARAVIDLGEVCIDTAARRVFKGGFAVELTAREYGLVEYLALHRGVVVSRTQLYDHLFDEHNDPLSNVLEVHMSHLRKKLGAGLISTRRGLGYWIEA